MKKLAFSFLLLGLIMSGCALRNRGLSKGTPTAASLPADSPTETATQIPPAASSTPTLAPTPSPTPDFSQVGLPSESSGQVALDLVSQVCQAGWFNGDQALPCPGTDQQQGRGYVMSLDGSSQGLPSDFSLLLTFPPVTYFGTLYSKYPPFMVVKGDRFRAVLACRAHSFCDVQFGLEYYDAGGKTGLRHWSYLFAEPPIVVDYPLDKLADKSVQLSLTVTARGNPSDAYAVWIAPHIYRPAQ